MRNASKATAARSHLAAAARRATPAVVQPMERRVLMSAAVLTNGVLTVTGTAGNDTISVNVDYADQDVVTAVVNGTTQQFSATGLTGVVINAGAGNDSVTMTTYDVVPGTTINGGDGADTINAMLGDALVSNAPAGSGISIDGGTGDDSIKLLIPEYPSNSAVPVSITGDDGNDTISYTGDPDATLHGGAGNDTISAIGNGTDQMYGDDGDDSLIANGYTGGYFYADMFGGAGNDSFSLSSDTDFITVSGGDGNDSITMTDDVYGPLTVDLSGGASVGNVSTPYDDVENFTAINVASAQPVEVIGNAQNNVIRVSASNGAILIGGDGNDLLDATGSRVATVNGGDGNDTLVGGGGGTTFSGGAGTDTVDYSAQTAGVTVYLDGSKPSGTADQITYGYGDTFDGTVEVVDGGSGNDLIYAAPGGGDGLYGNGGNDTLVAQGGADALFGGDGNDTFQAADGGTTYIDGGAGTDTAAIDATGDSTTNVETITVPAGTVQLTGTTYGTAGSYANSGNTVAKATDGDLTTFFDGPTANGDTVDIDLGSARTVGQIRYAPRAGWAARMVGGTFQASNTADFSSGVVTVYTVTATPATGTVTTVTPTTTTAYRYWRYVAPAGSYGDIAEFQLFGPASTTPTPTPTATQVTGTTYGTAGSYQNDGNTVANATDGNVNTYFDGPTANGNYVAIDAGPYQATVTQIAFAPRAGWAARMVGGIFQASDTPDFSSFVTNLYTITTAPAVGTLTTVTLGSASTHRYFRYLSPNGSYGNIAEFQLFGVPSPIATRLIGVTAGTAGSYQNAGNTVGMATDGNFNTFFDGPTANGDAVVVDLGAATLVTQIRYVPRSGYASRMFGGVFQASNAADFSSGVVTVYSVTSVPPVGTFTTVIPATTTPYRYWRYLAPNGSYGNIAEFQLYGSASTAAPTTLLTGTTYGTTGSYNNDGNTVAKATDRDATTYFDGPVANGDYVAIDLGSAQTVHSIAFAPRAGWESRMVGGVFQASATADFSSDVISLYTISTAPPAGTLSSVSFGTPTTARYFRYLAPNGSYGDIAEFELFS